MANNDNILQRVLGKIELHTALSQPLQRNLAPIENGSGATLHSFASRYTRYQDISRRWIQGRLTGPLHTAPGSALSSSIVARYARLGSSFRPFTPNHRRPQSRAVPPLSPFGGFPVARALPVLPALQSDRSYPGYDAPDAPAFAADPEAQPDLDLDYYSEGEPTEIAPEPAWEVSDYATPAAPESYYEAAPNSYFNNPGQVPAPAYYPPAAALQPVMRITDFQPVIQRSLHSVAALPEAEAPADFLTSENATSFAPVALRMPLAQAPATPVIPAALGGPVPSFGQAGPAELFSGLGSTAAPAPRKGSDPLTAVPLYQASTPLSRVFERAQNGGPQLSNLWVSQPALPATVESGYAAPAMAMRQLTARPDPAPAPSIQNAPAPASLSRPEALVAPAAEPYAAGPQINRLPALASTITAEFADSEPATTAPQQSASQAPSIPGEQAASFAATRMYSAAEWTAELPALRYNPGLTVATPPVVQATGDYSSEPRPLGQPVARAIEPGFVPVVMRGLSVTSPLAAQEPSRPVGAAATPPTSTSTAALVGPAKSDQPALPPPLTLARSENPAPAQEISARSEAVALPRSEATPSPVAFPTPLMRAIENDAAYQPFKVTSVAFPTPLMRAMERAGNDLDAFAAQPAGAVNPENTAALDITYLAPATRGPRSQSQPANPVIAPARPTASGLYGAEGSDPVQRRYQEAPPTDPDYAQAMPVSSGAGLLQGYGPIGQSGWGAAQADLSALRHNPGLNRAADFGLAIETAGPPAPAPAVGRSLEGGYSPATQTAGTIRRAYEPGTSDAALEAMATPLRQTVARLYGFSPATPRPESAAPALINRASAAAAQSDLPSAPSASPLARVYDRLEAENSPAPLQLHAGSGAQAPATPDSTVDFSYASPPLLMSKASSYAPVAPAVPQVNRTVAPGPPAPVAVAGEVPAEGFNLSANRFAAERQQVLNSWTGDLPSLRSNPGWLMGAEQETAPAGSLQSAPFERLHPANLAAPAPAALQRDPQPTALTTPGVMSPGQRAFEPGDGADAIATPDWARFNPTFLTSPVSERVVERVVEKPVDRVVERVVEVEKIVERQADRRGYSAQSAADTAGDGVDWAAPADGTKSATAGSSARPLSLTSLIHPTTWIQRKAANGAEAPASPIGTPPINTILRTAVGRALDHEVGSRMSNLFGYRFDNVRVHADGDAADYAQRMGAQALTVGQHIVFAPGQYRPETSGGQALIGHELTHVVQQASLPSLGNGRIPETSAHGQALEHEALHNENLLMRHLENAQPATIMRTPGESIINPSLSPAALERVSEQAGQYASETLARSFEPVHLRSQAAPREETPPPGSFVQRQVDAAIMRAETTGTESSSPESGNGGQGGTSKEQEEAAKTEKLVEEVMRRVRYQLMVDRERHGTNGSRFF